MYTEIFFVSEASPYLRQVLPRKCFLTGPTKQSAEKEPEQAVGRTADAMAFVGVVARRVKVALEEPLVHLPTVYVTE